MELPILQAERFQINGQRWYKVEDRFYISVTSVLEVVGKPALVDWAKRTALESLMAELSSEEVITRERLRLAIEKAAGEPERVKSEAARQGSARHEELAKAQPNLPGLQVLASEYFLVSRRFGYAGTCDLVCRDANDNFVVIDWKTGGIWSEHALQVAGYAVALEEMGIPVRQGLVVELRKSPPVVWEVSLPTATEGFLAALSLWSALQKEGLLRPVATWNL